MTPMIDAAARFAAELARLKTERGLSYRALAEITTYSPSYVEELVKGKKPPNSDVAARLDETLGTGRWFVEILRPPEDDDAQAEIEAIELVRRVTASDVSPETLDRLERAVDKIAMAYAATPPDRLLQRVRKHLAYFERLVDARKTIDQHRRLLVVGGWLSLLRATLHVDLRQGVSAGAHLDAAVELAGQAGHCEIEAWCFETRAWQVLTGGDFRQAIELARRSQTIAPAGSSVLIQATAQEGRAWARLRDGAQTSAALSRVERLAGNRPRPVHPEHHYQYDPAKAHSYAATTLAWAGDPAAASVARDVIVELEQEGARPRRVASARLDLGLALLSAEQSDEAAAEARAAIESGRVVPSNWWRASEVVSGVARSGIAEAEDLRQVAAEYRPQLPA
jgi:transcriptional regulator with XRE-family HTH domain